MRLDLDEMEASLGFMNDWKLLIDEIRLLRELRECVSDYVFAKDENSFKERFRDLCVKLNEVRRG